MGTLGGWSKRQKLTIDHTQVDDELTDFPVKVIVSSDNPLFYTAKSDGSDVRFTAADGETLLKFEREVHDTTEKIAVYHVKIPSVSSTSDTDFYLYYGNASASDASSPNDVWDSNYKLVMHMGSSLEDSTSNSNDGTNYGTTLGLASDGYYRSFDGVDDYIQVADSPSLHITEAITIQAMVNPTAYLANGTVCTKNRSYYLQVNSDGKIAVYTYWNNNGSMGDSTYTYSTSTVPLNTWTHIAFVEQTDGTRKIYINGIVDKSTVAETGIWASIDPLGIGMERQVEGTSSRPFKGSIENVNVSSTARSDAWIKATSASLHDELLTFGSEEPAVTMMLAFNF